jgi:hypothetical protein
MMWVLNRLEPDSDKATPSCVQFVGRVYRRRATSQGCGDALWSRGGLAPPLRIVGTSYPFHASAGTPWRGGSRLRYPSVSRTRRSVGSRSQGWAKRVREQLKTKADGGTGSYSRRRRCGTSVACGIRSRSMSKPRRTSKSAAVIGLYYQSYCFHVTAQTLGNGVDDLRRPSHPESPRALVKWGLGGRPSAVLGFKIYAHNPGG